MVVTVVSVGSIAPEIVTFVGVLLMPPLLLSPPQPASTTSSVVSVAWRKGWNELGGLFMCSILRLSRDGEPPTEGAGERCSALTGCVLSVSASAAGLGCERATLPLAREAHTLFGQTIICDWCFPAQRRGSCQAVHRRYPG